MKLRREKKNEVNYLSLNNDQNAHKSRRKKEKN